MAGNTSVDQEEEEEDEDLGYTDTYSDYMPSKCKFYTLLQNCQFGTERLGYLWYGTQVTQVKYLVYVNM